MPIKTNALAMPPRNRNTSQSEGQLDQTHGERRGGDTHQAPAHSKRGTRRAHGAKQRTEQISEVVGCRDPARDRKRKTGVLLHQRQDRRQ